MDTCRANWRFLIVAAILLVSLRILTRALAIHAPACRPLWKGRPRPSTAVWLRRAKTSLRQMVQAHLARGAILAGKACEKLGLPLVVTTHNYIDVKYYKHVSMLVPPTKDQYAYYLSRGIASDRMRIINHFSPIKPERKIIKSSFEKQRIVALGRLVRKKGFHVLLEAFAMLKKKTNIQYELHRRVARCGGDTRGDRRRCAGADARAPR